MIVIREFRIGNRRFTKGDVYTGADAKKWLDAGYLQAKVAEKSATVKKETK